MKVMVYSAGDDMEHVMTNVLSDPDPIIMLIEHGLHKSFDVDLLVEFIDSNITSGMKGRAVYADYSMYRFGRKLTIPPSERLIVINKNLLTDVWSYEGNNFGDGSSGTRLLWMSKLTINEYGITSSDLGPTIPMFVGRGSLLLRRAILDGSGVGKVTGNLLPVDWQKIFRLQSVNTDLENVQCCICSSL